MYFYALPFNILHRPYWSRINMSFSVRGKGTMVAMDWMWGSWRGALGEEGKREGRAGIRKTERWFPC